MISFPLFTLAYLIIGIAISLYSLHRFLNDENMKNTIYADVVRMQKLRLIVLLSIGWLPLMVLAAINGNSPK